MDSGQEVLVSPSTGTEEIQPPVTSTIKEQDSTKSEERLGALDTLRGFALLGILLMNIIAMGMYFASYDDPSVTGGSAGPNLWVWVVMHVLAEGKMRCLFSMLFGAGIILLTSRLDAKGANSADVYYRRTGWLLLFGIVHAYLLWAGDILYPYALCALVLYPFRKMSAKGLTILATVLLVLDAAAYIGQGYGQREVIEKGKAALQAEKEGKKLTEEQESAKGSYERWRKYAHPSAEELNKDASGWRGNPLQVIGARAKIVSFVHNLPYYSPFNWDIWCMMLYGMALLKWGVLSGERPTSFYIKLMCIGYLIGIPVNSYTAWLIVKSNFDPVVREMTAATYDLGRLSIAAGHIGLLVLLIHKGWLRWLTGSLAAVGQMAFSNYIFQSVVTAFFFTGYGLKMYGRLERYQLYYVVLAIWVVQIIASPIWLRHYRFGPLEWCWRSLTYWRRQPLRITPKTEIAAAAAPSV